MSEESKLISSAVLPIPRLELRWQEKGEPSGWGEFRRECRYLLVMPLCKTDVRSDWVTSNAAPSKTGDAWEVVLGTTGCSGGFESPRVWLEAGRVDTPYRDGKHAAWDAFSLNLPAFAVCGQYAMPIEPEMAPKPGALIAELERVDHPKASGFALELLADLTEAAATLRRYETLHRAKGTADSLAKAEVNAELAARFEATILKAGGCVSDQAERDQ